MATAKQTFSDFSAGLVTAIDETLLPMNASPDLSNVELLRSGSIKRRKGYATVKNNLSATHIDALHRHYSNSGVNRWMAVSATRMLSTTGAFTMETFSEEAEALITSATYTRVAHAGYSGGYYLSATNLLRFTLPKCVSFEMNMQSVTASVSIDGGAYTAATNRVFSAASLAATSHTVAVKRQSVAHSGKFARTYDALQAYRLVPDNTEVDLHFYVDADTSGYIGLGDDTFVQSILRLKLNAGGSFGLEAVTTSGGLVSSMHIGTLSYGWHRLTLTLASGASATGSISLDGGTVYTSAVYCPNTPKLRVYGAPLSGVFLAELMVGGIFTDDFTSTNGWTVVTGEMTSSTEQTYTAGMFTTVGVDKFTYNASDEAWATVSNTLSTTTRTFGLASFGDSVYYNSPYDPLMCLPATSATPITVATAPMGGFLVEFKRRLYTCGKNNDRSLLEYSALDDPNTWTTTGDAGAGSVRIFGKDTGHDSTGLAVWNNAVYQFTKKGVGYYSAKAIASQSEAKVLSERYGCIAPKSLAVAPNSMVWLGADGVYTYGLMSGVTSTEDAGFGVISDKVADILDGMTDEARERAVGALYNGNYWLACDPNGTGKNDTVLIHRFATAELPSAWTRYSYSRLDISSMYVTRADEYALYAGTTDGDFVRLDHTDSDGAANIDMTYKTPPISSRGYQGLKHYRTLYLLAESDVPQTVSVAALTDDASPPAMSVTVDSATSRRPIRIPMSSRGRSLQVTISSSGAEQPLAVSGLTLFFDEQRSNR